MEHNVRVRFAAGFFAAATIGLSVVISTAVASRAYESRGRQAVEGRQEITVRGSARRAVTSDLGQWTITVRGTGEQLPAAFAVVEKGTERVQSFLRAAGFKEDQITLSAISTVTHYARDAKGNTLQQVNGYALSRSFTISTSDVARVAKAAGEVTQLLKDGVEVVSSRPEFYVTTLPDLRISIAGDAAKDARSRAEEIATKSGCRVAEVRSVSTGPIQVTEPNSTDVHGSGSYDTSTIAKDVSMTVNVTFGLRNTD